MSAEIKLETYAAVDLGSNSFHLLVARREHGELRVLDRIREMVRLGGGLGPDGQLNPEIEQRARHCLARFAVDPAQVERVRRTALELFDQLAPGQPVSRSHRVLLAWASELHETGLALSHDNYQQHSAYLVEASDMAGFSRQEQLFLAALVGFQRRDLPADYAARLPKRLHKALRITLLCMRLAWIFCRSREDQAIAAFRIRLADPEVFLALPAHWMETHPLTMTDLESECRALKKTGLDLQIVYLEAETDD